jgi:hypothetical protein
MMWLYLFLASIPLSLPVLWVLYLAVMSLKRVYDSGKMARTTYVLGHIVTQFAYIVDVYCNVFLFTLLMWEIPREGLVTDRLIRHHKTSTGWRLKIVLWLEPLLDPFDPSGDHV